MPLYTFKCHDCDFEEDSIISMSERDTVQISCPKCGTFMKRMMNAPTIGRPAYQMGAVMGSGEHIAGHFGKDAGKK